MPPRRAAKKAPKKAAKKVKPKHGRPQRPAKRTAGTAAKASVKNAKAKRAAKQAPTIGSLDLVTVHVDDLEEACDFYGNKLGLPQVMRDDGVQWAMFQAGKTQIGVHVDMDNNEGGRQPPSVTGFMFGVKDVDQAVDKLRGAGVKILSGPTDAPWGRHAEIEDPSGNSMFVCRF